ncbi:proline utilization trans-activator [Microdochium nivale]|nr:proline utilization trans-activator [Microdochium nivale]
MLHMTESGPRRRRPAVSCTLCRRRKIRCNKELPCSNCRKSSKNHCVFDSPPRPSQVSNTANTKANETDTDTASSLSEETSLGATPSTVATSLGPPSQALESDCFNLKLRVRQLEHQLQHTSTGQSAALRSTCLSSLETTSSRVSGTFHLLRETSTTGRSQRIVQRVAHKARLFGQSHWVAHGVPLIRDAFEAIEGRLQNQASDGWRKVEECKSLARDIKAQLLPPWPAVLSAQLPARELADSLVESYLTTVESFYRILHIPSFHAEYEALWATGVQPDSSVLVQVKLVLALGAVTHDDNFSLRPLAMGWVYEAQTWISEPRFKERLNLKFLQTTLLLMFAQERLGISSDAMWISAGTLVRKAILMGLHRDPSRLNRGCDLFAAEMHRRLWNTIVEVAIQSALSSGGPPLIALEDFDTLPPGDYNDEQIAGGVHPLPGLSTRTTQMTIPLRLRSTLAQRLTVVKYLNDLTPHGSYEETLRLDKELRTAYKALTLSVAPRQASLAGGSSSASIAPDQPTLFQTHVLSTLLNLYLLALHLPYFGPSLQETAYAYSRKVVVDLSLRIWRTTCPVPSSSVSASDQVNDLPRLALCSAGLFPTAAVHAAFLVGVDVRMQLEEQQDMGAIVVRPDLVSVLDEARKWCLKNIEAGETNIKGYLLVSVVIAQVQALTSGSGGGSVSSESAAGLLVEAVEQVGEECLPRLTSMLAKTRGAESVPLVTLSSGNVLPESLDTDFLSGSICDDPMSWMLVSDVDTLMPSLW